MTIGPWSKGKNPLWDVTASCTASNSYESNSSISAGWVAQRSADGKIKKYSSLIPKYIFVPLAFETLGRACIDATTFLKELAKRMEDVSGDPRERDYLQQRFSLAICKGNIQSIIHSMGLPDDPF